MAAYSSIADGNWSAVGGSTWNGTNRPGTGDSAVVNNAITADISLTVGDGTAGSLTIASGATLTIAANVILSVFGGIVNSAGIVMSAGSGIVFVQGVISASFAVQCGSGGGSYEA